MTQTPDRPGACLIDACTQACTTECREAINRAWTLLRGTQRVQPTDRPGIDEMPSDQLDQLYGERDLARHLLAKVRETSANLINQQQLRAERAEGALNAIRALAAELDSECPWASDATAIADRLRIVLDQHG